MASAGRNVRFLTPDAVRRAELYKTGCDAIACGLCLFLAKRITRRSVPKKTGAVRTFLRAGTFTLP